MASTTPQNQARFLEHLESAVSIQAACKSAGVSATTVSRWRTADTNGFAAKFAMANEQRLNLLEDRMFQCLDWATTPENFDKLLRYPTLYMFALKAGKPQYRDSVQSAQGAADLVAALAKLNDADGDVVPKVEDNTQMDDNRRKIIITQENHQKLEGSVSDQLKEIFGYRED